MKKTILEAMDLMIQKMPEEMAEQIQGMVAIREMVRDLSEKKWKGMDGGDRVSWVYDHLDKFETLHYYEAMVWPRHSEAYPVYFAWPEILTDDEILEKAAEQCGGSFFTTECYKDLCEPREITREEWDGRLSPEEYIAQEYGDEDDEYEEDEYGDEDEYEYEDAGEDERNGPSVGELIDTATSRCGDICQDSEAKEDLGFCR